MPIEIHKFFYDKAFQIKKRACTLPFCVSFVEQRKDVIQKDSFVALVAWLLLPRRTPLEKGSER